MLSNHFPCVLLKSYSVSYTLRWQAVLKYKTFDLLKFIADLSFRKIPQERPPIYLNFSGSLHENHVQSEYHTEIYNPVGGGTLQFERAKPHFAVTPVV